MTFSPNVVHLLQEQIVTGAAATDIFFTGLDMNSDRHYTLYYDIANATAAPVIYELFVNGDTTATHYWAQTWNFSNVATANSRENAPDITGTINANQYCSGYVDIFLGVQGFFQYISYSGRNFTNAGATGASLIMGARTFNVIANITSLTIHDNSASNAIGIGSTFRLYKTATV